MDSALAKLATDPNDNSLSGESMTKIDDMNKQLLLLTDELGSALMNQSVPNSKGVSI
jgi:hypothetical protein